MTSRLEKSSWPSHWMDVSLGLFCPIRQVKIDDVTFHFLQQEIAIHFLFHHHLISLGAARVRRSSLTEVDRFVFWPSFEGHACEFLWPLTKLQGWPQRGFECRILTTSPSLTIGPKLTIGFLTKPSWRMLTYVILDGLTSIDSLIFWLGLIGIWICILAQISKQIADL